MIKQYQIMHLSELFSPIINHIEHQEAAGIDQADWLTQAILAKAFWGDWC